jgi:hypothetical protein
MEKLGDNTHALSGLIHGNLCRIKELENEKLGTTGELKDAIDTLIKDKVWKIQQAIGVFWRESLDITMPSTTTFLFHPPFSGSS